VLVIMERSSGTAQSATAGLAGVTSASKGVLFIIFVGEDRKEKK
jgi:hypothetical protein